jgi:hypothetical protein
MRQPADGIYDRDPTMIEDFLEFDRGFLTLASG